MAHASGNFPRRDKRQLNDVRGLARGVNNTEFNKPRCSWRTRKSNIWLGRRLSSKARRASNFPDCSPVAYAAINRIWQLWLLDQWLAEASVTIWYFFYSAYSNDKTMNDKIVSFFIMQSLWKNYENRENCNSKNNNERNIWGLAKHFYNLWLQEIKSHVLIDINQCQYQY